jgi:Predicted redox protein, regulator of disulfide bond formation
MRSEDLRALQAPLKERYRDEPGAAILILRAEGTLGDGVACSVDTGRALVEAGLHPATGGTGVQACSGDMLLQALVACAGVTLSAVATALEIPIQGGRVLAEGDLDFRGTLGLSKETPVGFSEIRVHFSLESTASPEQLAKLIELTERYCVVLQTLRSPVNVKTTVGG